MMNFTTSVTNNVSRNNTSSNNNNNPMDGYVAIQHYLDRIVHGDDKCKGMKALLLDAATTQIVSAVYSQTEILKQQVYLVTRLDKLGKKQSSSSLLLSNNSSSSNPEKNGLLLEDGRLNSNNNNNNNSNTGADVDNSHLKAIIFVRPTAANIDAIASELQSPRFVEYHIFVTGMLDSGLLRVLAEHDLEEKVRQVQEFFADFVPINEDLWTLQCRNTVSMSMAAGTSWAPKYATQYERNIQGIQSMLLALKKQPSVIRYAGHSPCAEELAKDIHDAIVADEIFHFRRKKATSVNDGQQVHGGFMLLVLDRRDDPVTPLLSQWTYQAMVHELLGLNNHRVLLRGAPNVSKDLEEVVLNASQDEFFKRNRHANFGQLGEEIQHMLQEYQKQTAIHQPNNLNSIEEMQAFMERFPELKSQSHTVSKHVAIMGELARLVELCSLMDVSQFEQELACTDDHNTHWRELMQKLQSTSVKIPDKLRLGLLYALRYESIGNMHMVQNAMSKGGVPPDMVQLMNHMLRYGGSKSRGPGLYGDNHNLMSKMTKSFMTSVQGVQNVYSQHVPLVMDTIQSILKGKLSPRDYPVVPGSSIIRNAADLVPDEILVFMVGGVTYEEGTKIAEFNEQMKGRVRVVLGGSTVHNSTSFLDELKATSF